MKRHVSNQTTFVSTLALCLLSLLFGCTGEPRVKGDLVKFLSEEMDSLGGKGGALRGASSAQLGKWTVQHDGSGILVHVLEPSYAEIRKILDGAFGEPTVYSPAKQNQKTIYVYPAAKVGIGMTITEVNAMTEISLFRAPARGLAD